MKSVHLFVCLVGWFLASPSATRISHARTPRLTSGILTCCHTEIERGGLEDCLSRSHYYYTDTYPITREWAPRAGIEPTTYRLNKSHALYRLNYSPPPASNLSTVFCSCDRGKEWNKKLRLELGISEPYL